MKRLCLIGLVFSLSAACSEPHHGQSSPSQPRAPASERVVCTSGIESPWSCLEQACEHAGGRYEASSHECRCPDQTGFVGWHFPRCASHEVSASGPHLTVQEVREESLRQHLEVNLSAADSYRADEVAEALSRYNVPSFAEDRTILMKEIADTPLPAGDLDRLMFIAEPPIDFDFRQTSLPKGDFLEIQYFSNISQILSILAGRDAYDPVRDVVPGSIPSAAELNAGLSAPVASETVTPLSEAGCLDACVVRRVLNVAAYPALRFEQTIAWSGGVPYRNVLVIRQPEGFAKAMGLLSPRGRPLLLVGFNRQATSAGLTTQADFYNTSGAKVASRTSALGTNQIQAVRSGARADVLMCESLTAFDWKNQRLQDHLLRGPLAANDPQPGKSFWGWLKPAGLGPEFYSGLSALSPAGFFDYSQLSEPFHFEEFEHHAEQVLRLLVDDGKADLTAAPMGPVECNRQKILESGMAAADLPRIINYSTGEQKSPGACSKAYPELANTPFLWIFAAGNSSFNTDEKVQTICPQNSVPHAKRIIVGSVKNGRVAKYSNNGLQYTDIFAEGETCPSGAGCEENASGTSFAAPRVAKVAAQIAKDYPSLTNQQIRLAILLGADISNTMPALSKGVLDEPEAMGYARRLSQNPDPDKAIRNNYRGFCKLRMECRAKLKILKDIQAAGI